MNYIRIEHCKEELRKEFEERLRDLIKYEQGYLDIIEPKSRMTPDRNVDIAVDEFLKKETEEYIHWYKELSDEQCSKLNMDYRNTITEKTYTLASHIHAETISGVVIENFKLPFQNQIKDINPFDYGILIKDKPYPVNINDYTWYTIFIFDNYSDNEYLMDRYMKSFRYTTIRKVNIQTPDGNKFCIMLYVPLNKVYTNKHIELYYPVTDVRYVRGVFDVQGISTQTYRKQYFTKAYEGYKCDIVYPAKIYLMSNISDLLERYSCYYREDIPDICKYVKISIDTDKLYREDMYGDNVFYTVDDIKANLVFLS